MIFEILELFYMIENNVFVYWPIHFLFFLVAATIIRGALSRRYKPYSTGLDRKNVKVTVLIPEFNEEIEIFERCIKSAVANRPDEIIVIYDDGRKEIEQIARKYGAKTVNTLVFSSTEKLGKRASLALGWLMAKGDIVVQLDSDTVMKPHTIEELVKPFSDPKVVGVQGHPQLFRTGERIPYLFGQIIELSRDVVSRFLNGEMIVIDGKIAAYRREFLVKHANDFLTEAWDGRKIALADDRALTFLANIEGHRTVYQSTAEAMSAAQPTLVKFIYQQLRWARSGYLYLIKDLKSGLFFRSTRKYRFQMLMYLLAPISFTAAWMQTVIANVHVVGEVGSFLEAALTYNLPVTAVSVVVFVFGIVLTTQFSLRGMGVSTRSLHINLLEYIAMGLLGLFVIYPLFIYSMLTYKNVTQWLTR
ncbi:hypothetical protein HS1genome_0572 [Sulfodiicoccus acidiphilus]|uniref:Glycosyltransferase 2-like domain-containing protein n=1 Tax=Sulfodiicoccus acidiphilus TaxID=1670455 RepID=A0A348B1Y1_9CREN|nr:glycosyltransferase [Sulfodiicoccus acidiphilus]BBD72183.1 hypothetical protein HS1genome_0572 [Sulfodiicoccus acidiphilus]GGT94391.1 hypothetical protein GCM10007116_09980 [Sulfodiicoccus acidiphilus]